MCCGPYRYAHSLGCDRAPADLQVYVDALKRLEVGEYVWFKGERNRYTVQARDDRWLICTKPFAARHTVIYCIVDLEAGVRGVDNLIFSTGYETREQCEENLARLAAGKMEISQRNHAVVQLRQTQRVTSPVAA